MPHSPGETKKQQRKGGIGHHQRLSWRDRHQRFHAGEPTNQASDSECCTSEAKVTSASYGEGSNLNRCHSNYDTTPSCRRAPAVSQFLVENLGHFAVQDGTVSQ